MPQFLRRSNIRGACLAAAAMLLASAAAYGQRPPAQELLPKNTALLMRVASATDLKERFMNTSMGRLSQDEKVAPLFAELFGSATELFQQIEGEVGVTLPELLSIPQGEVAVAVVAAAGRMPDYVLFIDVGEKKDVAEKLLAKATEALEKELGKPGVEEDLEGQKIRLYSLPEEPEELIIFEKDGTFVAVTSKSLAKEMIVRWAGTPGKPVENSLAKNERYNAIMKRCRGEKGQEPQLAFFADPLAIARSAASGNFAATATLALLPSLGLDGFSGVGGTIALDAEPYDYISHFHLLLENPRSGVLEALALQEGDNAPPKWVPADANTYISMNWNFPKTYEQVAKLVDMFQGEGRTEKGVSRFFTEQAGGLDFHKDVLDQLTGRVIHVTWIKPSVRLDSQIQCIALPVKDPEAAAAAWKKVVEKHKDSLVEKSLAGVTFWKPKIGGPQPPPGAAPAGDAPAGEGGEEEEVFPIPVFAIVGDTIFVTREAFLRKIILAGKDPNVQSLADTDEYKLVAGRFDRVAAGARPGMITYSQPEYSMRWLYEMATGENAKAILENPDAADPVRRLNDALTKHPLPPFSVIQQYLAPTGGVMVNEPTGFHYTGFGLRRAAPK